MSEGNIQLPYYLINGDKIRMSLDSDVQTVDRDSFDAQMRRISDIYTFFSLLYMLPEYTTGLPVDIQKAPTLARELQNGIPSPLTAAARLDIVDGKVVDINNKPAGLGLILRAFRKWEANGILAPETNALTPNVTGTLGSWGAVNMVTEKSYPFSSDQLAIVAEVTSQTGNEWKRTYADLMPPPTDSDPVFSFSYLDSPNVTKDWLKFFKDNQDQFALNPLSAVYWDNKALMALPFLPLEGLPDSLQESGLRVRNAFPETYLIRLGANKNPEVAVGFSKNGVQFAEVDKDTAPVLGTTYLKPLGMSGSKGIQIKRYDSWQNARDGLNGYADRYPDGFIAQQGTTPESINGMAIKDGYFVDASSGTAEYIALERMGTTADAKKIHGGSRTKLIPVLIEQ